MSEVQEYCLMQRYLCYEEACSFSLTANVTLREHGDWRILKYVLFAKEKSKNFKKTRFQHKWDSKKLVLQFVFLIHAFQWSSQKSDVLFLMK